MWKALKQSKSAEGETRSSMLRKMTGKLGALQHRWADKLQEKSERLSVTGKKLMLGLFLAVFSGWSVYIAWHSLSSSPGHGTVPVQPITISHPGEGMVTQRPFAGRQGVSDKEYGAIQAFHHYLDSLGQSTQGRIWRDSLLKGRPGLLDSMRAIEQVYLSQSKK